MGSEQYAGVNPQSWIIPAVASDAAIIKGQQVINQMLSGKQVSHSSLIETTRLLSKKVGTGVGGPPAKHLLKSLYYNSPSLIEQSAIAVELLNPNAELLLEELLTTQDAKNILGKSLAPKTVSMFLDAAVMADTNAQNTQLINIIRAIGEPGAGNSGIPPVPPGGTGLITPDGPDPSRWSRVFRSNAGQIDATRFRAMVMNPSLSIASLSSEFQLDSGQLNQNLQALLCYSIGQ